MSSDSSNSRSISGIRKVFSHNSDFFCYLVLFILASLLFLLIVFSGQTTLLPEYEDFAQWPIYREFISQSFSRGYFPLWCDGLYSGLDFVGWGHSSAFYPLALFFHIFSYARAAPLNQYLHFLIAVFGFFFLSRTIGLKKKSALISSAGYGFAYLPAAMILNHLPQIFCLVYMPWVYALSLKLMAGPKIAIFAILTVILCLQFLGGHLELFTLQNLSLLLIAAILVIRDRPRYQLTFRGIVLLFLAFGSVLLLSAITFVPSVASYGQSYRVLDYSYNYYLDARNSEIYFTALLWLMLFLSPIFCLFVYQGVKKYRTPVYMALAAAALFSLLNAVNWFNLFSPWYYLPLLSKIPSRGASIHIFILCLFLVFGAGIDGFTENRPPIFFRVVILFSAIECVFFAAIYYLLSPLVKTNPEQQGGVVLGYLISRQIIALLLIISFAILIAVKFIFKFPKLNIFRCLELFVGMEFLITGFSLIPRHPLNIVDRNSDYLRFLSTIDSGEYRIQSVFPSDLWSAIRIPVQTGVFFNTRSPDAFINFSTLRYADFLKLLDPAAIKYANGKIQDVGVSFVLKKGDFLTNANLPLVNLLNLKYVVGEKKNINSPTSYEIAYEDYRFSPGIRVVRGSSYRTLMVDPPANFGLSLYFTPGDKLNMKITCKDNLSPSILQVIFIDTANQSNLILSKLIGKSDKLSLDLTGLSNQSGSLVFSFIPLGDPSDDMSYDTSFTIDNPQKHFKRLTYQDIDVFENPTALPRSFLAHGAKIITDREARLKYLKSPDFDPAQTALLNDAPFIRFPEKMPMLKNESVNYLEQESFSGDVKLSAENIAPAILIFSEQYYPGWHAWLDGRETKIVPVDHCFKAVVLAEPGLHSLSLKYAPPSFELGLWVTIATILSWSVLLAVKFVPGQKPQAPAKI